MMRIAVFGTGGVGGYFGGRLAQAGEEVTFIARGAHLQAMQERGLRVESINGDFAVRPVQATGNPAEIGEVDLVILGVKTWQVPAAAEAMRPLIGQETIVLPLENGVQAPQELADALGAEHVLGGLCRIISFVAEPGLIRHVGANPSIALGELDNRRSERVVQLERLLNQAVGVTAEIPDDIQVALWRKFLLIVSWSGVGAITRMPVGIFRSQPETRAMLEGVMMEVMAVAQAKGIDLPDDVVTQTLGFMDNIPAGGTSSMQRDIMEERPSELDAQNGAVVRLGQEVGVPTPLNQFIYHSLLPLERKARGELIF